MKFYEYALIFKRRFILFITIVGVMLGVALLIGMMSQPRYNVTSMMTFSLEDSQNTQNYKYSNFYAEQSALEFTRTISGWYKDPYFQDHVFRAAGVDYNSEASLKSKLLGFFSTKRIERQNILTTFSATTKQNAEKLAEGLKRVIQHRLDVYNEISLSQYKLAYPSQFIELEETPWMILIVGGILFGIVLALFIIYLLEMTQGKVILSEDVIDIFDKSPFDIIRDGHGKDQRYFRMRALEEKPFTTILTVDANQSVAQSLDAQLFHFPNDTAKAKDMQETILVLIQLGMTHTKDLYRVRQLLQGKKWEYLIIQ